jgi:hypothetical protein
MNCSSLHWNRARMDLGTVLSYCALILCSHTVLSYCALILCSPTVLSYCALILCYGFYN